MARPADTMQTSYQHIEVTPVNGAVGAEIGGVDLSSPIPECVVGEIHRAFLAHSALVFRGQDVEPAAQVAFTSIFGEVVGHPHLRSAQIDGFPQILVLEHKAGQFFNGRNDIWHSDLTCEEKPPLGSVLHCRACWEGFGDTMFANQYLAWETLSGAMQSMLDSLEAEHDAVAQAKRNNIPLGEIPPAVRHPVVRTHPETGRKSLFVNENFTTGIVGLPKDEGHTLLDFLYRHATQPHFIYRHRWRVGDVVMFDNRCLLHYVVPDYPPQMHRRMHRTTAAGDRPL